MDTIANVNLQDLKTLLAAMDDGLNAQARDMLDTLIGKHEEAFAMRVVRAADRAFSGEKYVNVCKPGDPNFKIDDRGNCLWITAWLRVERSELEE